MNPGIDQDSDSPLFAARISTYPSSLFFDSSSVYISEIPQNTEGASMNDDSRTRSIVTSKYYLCQHDICKTKQISSSSSIKYDILPTSAMNVISQR